MLKNDIREKAIKKLHSKDKNPDITRLDGLHLELPDNKAVTSAYQQHIPELKDFSKKTQLILNASKEFGQLKPAKQRSFSKAGLKADGISDGRFTYAKKSLENFAAHAGYEHHGHYDDEFVNLKNNEKNLADGKLFPGINLIKRQKLSKVKNEKTKKWETQLRDEAEAYKVNNIESFISEIKDMYKQANKPLHPITESLIRDHIANNDGVLPTMAGIAGLHAEVQALNNLLILADERAGKPIGSRKIGEYMRDMLESSIFTQRLTTKQAGDDFAACHNCSGILSTPANVITGKVASAGSNFALTLARYKASQESPI
ncbi:YwqJ-related putative deaminase [Photorhabdus luminescens]|uniref:YwqJ-related putative deaminase n=1 Tax=Photorhabdus luminescens TaxID=29488 RepID=UPI00223FC63E|nr:YwqJ-related putative deaminase [Photorhabdus luminescens]MCW7762597.1 YwqJ-related putative deaminase [Photorhabdus luminescens subsp. venezuelensis]